MNAISIIRQKHTVAAYTYGTLPLWSSIMFSNRDQEGTKGFLRKHM